MTPIVALKPDHGAFPVSDCATCRTRTLVWLDVTPEGEFERCVSCNERVGDSPQVVGAKAVRSLGYVFLDEARERARNIVKKSKCGSNGVRGCGSGGCSSGGSCGSSGGCSSGGCG